jgi:flagellar biosynthesis regulator FlaF
MLKNPKSYKTKYNQSIRAEFYAGAVWFYFVEDLIRDEENCPIYTMPEELFHKLFS